MTYHVITPFSRWFNLIELGDCLKRQGVQWHLLLDEGRRTHDLGSWVHQHEYPPPDNGQFIGHWMVNQFIEKSGLVDEDRYVTLTDDDFTEPGFFRKLDAYDDDVLIVSMQRSNVPSDGGGECAFGTLHAKPENIRVGWVGLEQMVIKGKLLKQYRLGNRYEADGDLIMKLFEEHMEKFRFVPEALVYFDYLYPGRGKCHRWER